MAGTDQPGGVAPTLTVVILTMNEERHIARAIASVLGIASRVLVVDSGSTDATVAIASAAGATCVVHPFVTQAAQFDWALTNCGIATDWIMRLDADEVIEDDLRAEIAARLPTLGRDVVGVEFARKHVFMGRWIRHGGRYPLVLLRLWRRGHGRVEQRWMDEHVLTWGGRVVRFDGSFADINEHDLGFFTAKHNGYATREAIDVLVRRYGLDDESGETNGPDGQAARKRVVKEGFYNRLPLAIGPLAYFLYRYVVQFGFLDGREGLIYHVLQGFWYRFLVAAKLEEYDRALRPLGSPAERCARLSVLTGYRIGGASLEA